jgi:hypothetical protein
MRHLREQGDVRGVEAGQPAERRRRLPLARHCEEVPPAAHHLRGK